LIESLQQILKEKTQNIFLFELTDYVR
jgi:hypothetical protein